MFKIIEKDVHAKYSKLPGDEESAVILEEEDDAESANNAEMEEEKLENLKTKVYLYTIINTF